LGSVKVLKLANFKSMDVGAEEPRIDGRNLTRIGNRMPAELFSAPLVDPRIADGLKRTERGNVFRTSH
jgi:hypothetical protein